MNIIRLERNQYVKNKQLIDFFLEMEHSIPNVLIELEKQRDNVLQKSEIGGEQERTLHRMKSLYYAIDKLPHLFKLGDKHKIIEHTELILSLLYSSFVHIWGEGYWNDTIRCHLTKEEMLLLAEEHLS